MVKTAKRKDQQLWEKVKRELIGSDKGGRSGEWSARKAQFGVQEYKRAGGRYEGPKDPDNSLRQWQAEDWGTKSGRKSLDSGERYLPRRAREALSDQDYRRTTAKKRADTAKGRQFSSQPRDIARKTARYRDSPSRADLYELARKRGVKGRSRMSKAELGASLGK